MIPLIIGISVISYAIIILAPGDPAKLLADPEKLTAESYISMRAELAGRLRTCESCLAVSF